jgi:hypothetical protein
LQLPVEKHAPVLAEVNPCSISPKPEKHYQFEINEEEHVVETRSATKRSVRKSQTEEEEAPAKKRPCKPKQPPMASFPAAAPPKENPKWVEEFHFVVSVSVDFLCCLK